MPLTSKLVALLGFVVATQTACSCSEPQARPDDEAGEHGGVTPSTGDGPGDDDDNGTGQDDDDDDDDDGDSGASSDDCPEPRECAGGECCDVGEMCHQGVCVRDCGNETPACGEQQDCCEDAELCYLGACITPGSECGDESCATIEGEGVCEEGEVCDPVLGLCVPKNANDECEYIPPPQVFDPSPLFTWGERRERACTTADDCQQKEDCVASLCTPTWSHIDIAPDDLPEHKQVSSVPMVVDLDQDCVPEIVFNSYAASNYRGDGVLRAIRGDNGNKVWTLSDPAHRTDGTASPAVGDIDGDGVPEVLIQGDGSHLLAAAADGTFLWQSDPFVSPRNSGSPALANLDGDGEVEIIFGAAVFDHLGGLQWEGTDGVGTGGNQGPIPCIADLDGDGRPELVGGKTAYTFTGTVAGGDFAGTPLWDTAIADGYCGVADLQGDEAPEVVLVASGTIYLLDGPTGVELASLAIPGGGHGGAPNIADFDGDGFADIATAGGSNYVVVSTGGDAALSLLWQAPTEDDSSNRTGSSVFDFDGDGRAEVVYNDEEYVRIYPGVEPDCDLTPPGPECDGIMNDGEVLFADLSSSRTRTEYPVVADVDGDFKAELLFSTNNEAPFLEEALRGDAGIEVWRDELDNWMPTLPVWNQHSFHVTNVARDGTIPTQEPDSWSFPDEHPYNSYRRNAQGERDYCAPDLVPQGLAYDEDSCPDLMLSVWVVNRGCLGVGPGVAVAFYEETIGLLGVAHTQNTLMPGVGEQVFLTYEQETSGARTIWARVDDDGMDMGELNECEEDNNTHPPIVACAPIE